MSLDALLAGPARDLFAVLDTYMVEEVGEMRLLTTLAAIGGAKNPTMPSTRQFLDELYEKLDTSVHPTDSRAAREGQAAAEALAPAAG